MRPVGPTLLVLGRQLVSGRPVCARVSSRSVVDRGCEAHMCSCVEPVTGGVDPVSVKGHQCVMGDIVGNSSTLVVGGGLNQLKRAGVSHLLGLAFGV